MDEAKAVDRLSNRTIRTFVLRQGRMTPSQKEALAALYPQWGISWHPDHPLDPVAIFGRQAPLVIEIGSGMGDATARIAEANPEINFIAIEVHGPGVGNLLKLIEARRLTNLRVLRHDAVEVLERVILPETLSAIHLFFPDPWPKKQHHKRRIIQPPLVHLMATRLKPGGYLHCATDWSDYAEWMRAVLDAEPLLENAYPETGFAQPRPPWRPRTKFEARGTALGHPVWDLVYRRRYALPSDSTPP
ncbi:MAG: tRNA (guanosine(46)-N7)-methyltransferase TrmB [Hydrogenophilus sp.]|nr:tRNA (guanosine(46)-N7)-methyltransferase TrmB [Hydrogenophilus sp.]